MSADNVTLVRRAYEAFNRWAAQPQVAPLHPAVESLLHPEVAFHTYPSSPEAGVYRGRDAVIAYNHFVHQIRNVGGQLDDLQAEMLSIVEGNQV